MQSFLLEKKTHNRFMTSLHKFQRIESLRAKCNVAIDGDWTPVWIIEIVIGKGAL